MINIKEINKLIQRDNNYKKCKTTSRKYLIELNVKFGVDYYNDDINLIIKEIIMNEVSHENYKDIELINYNSNDLLNIKLFLKVRE